MNKHRSDGALVRLTTLIKPNEDWADGDVLISQFALALGDELEKYIPE